MNVIDFGYCFNKKKNFAVIEWGDHKTFKAYFDGKGVELSKSCSQEALDNVKDILINDNTYDELVKWSRIHNNWDEEWKFTKIKDTLYTLRTGWPVLRIGNKKVTYTNKYGREVTSHYAGR